MSVKSPKTMLVGGPLDGQEVEAVFNPLARLPYFKNKSNDWHDVVILQYLLTETTKKGRKAKFIGAET